jgi:hypothetical protein
MPCPADHESGGKRPLCFVLISFLRNVAALSSFPHDKFPDSALGWSEVPSYDVRVQIQYKSKKACDGANKSLSLNPASSTDCNFTSDVSTGEERYTCNRHELATGLGLEGG